MGRAGAAAQLSLSLDGRRMKIQERSANTMPCSLMRWFIVLVLLCTAAILSHSDQSIEELVRGEWQCPEITYLYIRFVSDYYIIGAYEGAGDLASGDYKFLDSRRISLLMPVFDLVYLVNPEFLAKVKNWVNKLWIKEQLVLQYNPNYATYLYTGSLDTESGQIVFNSTNETKEGAIFKQYGKQLIKEQGRFFVLENLLMRKGPSRESDSNYYEIKQILNKYKFESIAVYKYGYQTVKAAKARIVPKGYDLITIARTVDLNTINGRKAPWYLYYIETDDTESVNYVGWVFGGYLTKYSEDRALEYRIILEKNLREMDWLQPKVVEQ